jgi:hypothetical protein
MPFWLTLFDDQDGAAVFQGSFDTPEEAGRAAVTSRSEMMERGRELWPSVHRVDGAGRRHALGPADRDAFRAGIGIGMNELVDSGIGDPAIGPTD